MSQILDLLNYFPGDSESKMQQEAPGSSCTFTAFSCKGPADWSAIRTASGGPSGFDGGRRGCGRWRGGCSLWSCFVLWSFNYILSQTLYIYIYMYEYIYIYKYVYNVYTDIRTPECSWNPAMSLPSWMNWVIGRIGALVLDAGSGFGVNTA